LRSISASGEETDGFTEPIVKGRPRCGKQSSWARLPAGPLERHMREGDPEGVERRGSWKTLEGVDTFLGGAKFEEASACYLVRCGRIQNVALLVQKYRQILSYLWKSVEKHATNSISAAYRPPV
jgi:hypothetical protein